MRETDRHRAETETDKERMYVQESCEAVLYGMKVLIPRIRNKKAENAPSKSKC